MYVQEPQLEGIFDAVKAAYDRLRKVQPGKIILREAGYDPNANPRIDIVTDQSVKSQLLSTPVILMAAAALFILSSKRR